MDSIAQGLLDYHQPSVNLHTLIKYVSAQNKHYLLAAPQNAQNMHTFENAAAKSFVEACTIGQTASATPSTRHSTLLSDR